MIFILLSLTLPLQQGCAAPHAAKLVLAGESREIHERKAGAPPHSPKYPGLLVVALDGVGRDLLYGMLRAGELPELTRLMGGRSGNFPHAYFEENFLSTLPSSTVVAWVTAFTGVAPAKHGVVGNEFFIREERRFAAPVPVTFSDSTPVLATYTEEYVNKLCRAPSVYEQMRKRDPNVAIWVAMHQLYSGADKLLVTDRAVLADAFKAFLERQVTEKLAQKDSKAIYAALDEQVVDTVVDALDDDDEVLPDVLTVYLSGTDQFAHVAEMGPDPAQRQYMKEEIEPLMKRLFERLDAKRALDNRFVVITADHGHTEVLDDDEHALATDKQDDPPAVLIEAGFRVRPFRLNVSDDDDFSAVLAYQGAMAYVYLADRSMCPKSGQVCDFKRSPRFKEDVLAAAQAFYDANDTGKYVPSMRGTLDMVLARAPAQPRSEPKPFSVYVGKGRLVPIGEYLARHPHASYVAFEQRMRDLAVGKYGGRVGDVLLVAANGDREQPEQRYYFASRYKSWHGSPSRQDSEIPLIVAHTKLTSAELGRKVDDALGASPYQQRLTDLLLFLRYGSKSTPH